MKDKILQTNPMTILRWVLIATGVYFAIKFFNKAKNQVAGIEKITFLNPETQKLTLTELEAKALCSRVITDTYWFSSDSKVYQDLLSLPDNDLIYVSNIFNLNFSTESDGMTLAKFIAENKVMHSTPIKSLIERLQKLTKQ